MKMHNFIFTVISQNFYLQQLFRLYKLKKLSVGDNEIESLPPEVGNLTNLEELDISKNGKIFSFLVVFIYVYRTGLACVHFCYFCCQWRI